MPSTASLFADRLNLLLTPHLHARFHAAPTTDIWGSLTLYDADSPLCVVPPEFQDVDQLVELARLYLSALDCGGYGEEPPGNVKALRPEWSELGNRVVDLGYERGREIADEEGDARNHSYEMSDDYWRWQ